MNVGARLRALWRRWRGPAAPPPPPALPPLPAGTAARFSFVTSAYDTRPEFLRALAATIRAQQAPGAEWVLVDNGSRDPGTRACLQELGALPGTRLVRVETNRGILGGMQTALQAATTDFVIPVDSDDLLAPDTILALGHALLAEPGLRFLFSDEDHFTDGARCHPFLRAGWDPALALACSYIWHLCAFDRREALRLSVYADPGANYCHDWDTLLRFVRAGHRPHHVARILYSWRTHAASTTNNSKDAHQGSLASQRHVLNLHLQQTGLADRFVVADCPLWRGAPELRLERTAHALPAIDLVVTGDRVAAATLAAIEREVGAQVPIGRRWLLGTAADALPAGFVAVPGHAFAEIARTAAFGVLFRAASAAVREGDAVRDLVGWLELVPDAAVVGGRVVDAGGRVVSAGDWPGMDGVLRAPDAGRRDDDPGYLAMALKPRSAAAVREGCVLVRGAWLASFTVRVCALMASAQATVVAALCAASLESGRRNICTPFVTATR